MHTAMVPVIQVCRQLSSRTGRKHSGPASSWFYYKEKCIAFLNEDESLHLCELTLKVFDQTGR